MEELQLRDIVDAGYRFVAYCRACGYRASVSPASLMTHSDEAKFWTRYEIALKLKCSRCKTKLVTGKPSDAIVHQCLALERPARQSIAFQGGMLFEDK